MPADLPPIDELNRLDTADFAGTLARLFEHAPLLFERLAKRRPYRSYAALVAAAREIVSAMSQAEQATLLAAHPRLGAAPSSLSAASRREQGVPGPGAVAAELARLQDEYERRNGFRFVVCVGGRSREAILEVLRRRVGNPREVELATGLGEYFAICADRLGRSA